MKIFGYRHDNHHLILFIWIFLTVSGVANSWLQSSILGVISLLAFITQVFLIVTFRFGHSQSHVLPPETNLKVS